MTLTCRRWGGGGDQMETGLPHALVQRFYFHSLAVREAYLPVNPSCLYVHVSENTAVSETAQLAG